jgi:hypothetical protein
MAILDIRTRSNHDQINPCGPRKGHANHRTTHRAPGYEAARTRNRVSNLVPRAFLVVARELRKTLVKYDEISKILGDLSHAQ